MYCFDYYPKSKYPTLNGIDAKHREAILKFKDGYYKQAAYLLGDFLKGISGRMNGRTGRCA